MRHLGLVACVAIILAGTARAEERARSVLNKAIEAQGGVQALATLKAASFKQSGTVYNKDGSSRTAHAQLAIVLPDKLRYEASGPDGSPIITVFSGTHGWVKRGDKTSEMKPAQLAAAKELMYLLQVVSLVPLQNPSFKLTDLGPSTIDGRSVAGIKVSLAGHPDVQLFFDQGDGLLYKLATRGTDAQTGESYDREEVTWDYRDVGGMKAATRFSLWRDRKPVVEMSLSDYKCAPTLDDHLFTKP